MVWLWNSFQFKASDKISYFWFSFRKLFNSFIQFWKEWWNIYFQPKKVKHLHKNFLFCQKPMYPKTYLLKLSIIFEQMVTQSCMRSLDNWWRLMMIDDNWRKLILDSINDYQLSSVVTYHNYKRYSLVSTKIIFMLIILANS